MTFLHRAQRVPSRNVSSTQRRRERRGSAENAKQAGLEELYSRSQRQRAVFDASGKSALVLSALSLRSLRLCVEDAFRFGSDRAGNGSVFA